MAANESPADRQKKSGRLAAFLSRDGGIRTRDPLNPIQVRYRAALRPVHSGPATLCSANLAAGPKYTRDVGDRGIRIPCYPDSRILTGHEFGNTSRKPAQSPRTGIRMSTRVAPQRRNYIPMVLFYLIVAILAMS